LKKFNKKFLEYLYGDRKAEGGIAGDGHRVKSMLE
jgi:hypothetical protein